ncbi:MAG: hypothetical protein QMB94_10690, partial [Phycisphaerales bacterium]
MTHENSNAPDAASLDIEVALDDALVLLVDDNQQNLELMQAYLDDLPCRTETAMDGIEAMERIAQD